LPKGNPRAFSAEEDPVQRRRRTSISRSTTSRPMRMYFTFPCPMYASTPSTTAEILAATEASNPLYSTSVCAVVGDNPVCRSIKV